MSINAITIDQLTLACRHVEEMMSAGLTENFSIRLLELFADFYAKIRNGGSATPHAAKDVELWSIQAKKFSEENPGAKPKSYCIVEHGTPKRAFARDLLELYRSGNLTEESMNDLVSTKWKLAVVTLDENARLNKVARSIAFKTPEKRWAAANIEF